MYRSLKINRLLLVALLALLIITAFGVEKASAFTWNIDWIHPNQTISATKLSGSLNYLKSKLDALVTQVSDIGSGFTSSQTRIIDNKDNAKYNSMRSYADSRDRAYYSSIKHYVDSRDSGVRSYAQSRVYASVRRGCYVTQDTSYCRIPYRCRCSSWGCSTCYRGGHHRRTRVSCSGSSSIVSGWSSCR